MKKIFFYLISFVSKRRFVFYVIYECGNTSISNTVHLVNKEDILNRRKIAKMLAKDIEKNLDSYQLKMLNNKCFIQKQVNYIGWI